MKIVVFLDTSTKMEPSLSLCRLTVYPIKILVANGAPSPNPANRSSPVTGTQKHYDDRGLLYSCAGIITATRSRGYPHLHQIGAYWCGKIDMNKVIIAS